MPSMLLMEADVEEDDHTTLGTAAQGTDEFMDGACECDTENVYDLDWTISAMPAKGEEVETDIDWISHSSRQCGDIHAKRARNVFNAATSRQRFP